jgi:hypothetical protein
MFTVKVAVPTVLLVFIMVKPTLRVFPFSCRTRHRRAELRKKMPPRLPATGQRTTHTLQQSAWKNKKSDDQQIVYVTNCNHNRMAL